MLFYLWLVQLCDVCVCFLRFYFFLLNLFFSLLHTRSWKSKTKRVLFVCWFILHFRCGIFFFSSFPTSSSSCFGSFYSLSFCCAFSIIFFLICTLSRSLTLNFSLILSCCSIFCSFFPFSTFVSCVYIAAFTVVRFCFTLRSFTIEVVKWIRRRERENYISEEKEVLSYLLCICVSEWVIFFSVQILAIRNLRGAYLLNFSFFSLRSYADLLIHFE